MGCSIYGESNKIFLKRIGKEIITDERLREREKGPDGNNHGMFQKRCADQDYHEEGGEAIAMVQKRNMEALNEILSDNQGKKLLWEPMVLLLVQY